jgi:hypothetical protein
MIKNKIYFGIIVLGMITLFTSCVGGNTIDEGIDLVDIEDTFEDEAFEDLFESPDIDYHLPSALQVASIFKKSGMKYNSGVANDTENSSNYTTELQQMLNFGVYSADLAYCITNDQANESRKLMSVIKELADSQGMSAVFDNKDLMDRFDVNLDIQDSIEVIMIEIHERTEVYLDENDMMHTSAIHYAGAWVEGMYLGVYDFEHSEDNSNSNVGSQITEQMEILSNIIKGLKDPKNSDIDIEWVITDLKNIQTTYDAMDTVQEFYNDDNAIEMSLTKEEFISISGLVKDIRSKIVNA